MKRLPLISIFTLLVAGILLNILPISWLPYFYDVRYLGWSMILGALTIYLLPAFIRVPVNSPDAAKKNRAAELLQFLLIIALMANALGSLGLYELYQYGVPYSYILHVIIPLISALLLSIVINLRFKIRILYATIIAFCLVIICSIAWEVFENYSDNVWGTHLAVLGLGNTNNTTAVNLIQDTIGALIGVVIALLCPKFNKNFLIKIL